MENKDMRPMVDEILKKTQASRFSREAAGGSGDTSWLLEQGMKPQAQIAAAIDVGEQECFFQGASTGIKHLIILLYRVLEVGEWKTLSQRMTFSFHEKSTLSKVVRAAVGKEAALKVSGLQEVLGRWIGVEVSHSQGEDGKTYQNITNIFPVVGAPPQAPAFVMPEYFVTKYPEDTIISIS
jgi:hypothetical protein